MKYALIIAAILSISGCSKTASETTDSYKLPDELKDCRMFSLQNDSGGVMTVTRCPNSSTTTHSGKRTAVVIDGKRYIPEEE